ncbi:hypothetical protein QJR53_17425 [Yersinia enterocolitica]|uniref:hypothetical protein n=1 Tax=Yersinia enterocolitica TaxID=630 RepID=UPI0030CEF054
MLSKVCKERLEYLASLKGHVGQAVTMCRVELSDISTELLSLREQLAELKALEPVGYVGNSDLYALSTGDLGCIAPYNAFDGIPLFTAAKPAED